MLGGDYMRLVIEVSQHDYTLETVRITIPLEDVDPYKLKIKKDCIQIGRKVLFKSSTTIRQVLVHVLKGEEGGPKTIALLH